MNQNTAKDDIRVLKVQTRTLPVRLNDNELRQRGDELAVTVQELSAEEDRQKNLKDQMKARISELQARQQKLALIVSRREEFRDVEVACEVVADNMVREVRRDTGEVLLTRPFRDEERQYNMLQDGDKK